MSGVKVTAKVRSQEKLASDIYSLVLHAPEIATMAKPGQFVSLYSQNGANLLPRPISICEFDTAEGNIRF